MPTLEPHYFRIPYRPRNVMLIDKAGHMQGRRLAKRVRVQASALKPILRAVSELDVLGCQLEQAGTSKPCANTTQLTNYLHMAFQDFTGNRS